MKLIYSTTRKDFMNMIRACRKHQPSIRRLKILTFSMACVFISGLLSLNNGTIANSDLWWLRIPLIIFSFFAFWFCLLKSWWAPLAAQKNRQMGLQKAGQLELELNNEQFVLHSERQDTRYDIGSIDYILTINDYCFIILDRAKILGIPLRRSAITEGDFDEFTKALKTRWQAEPLTAAKIKKFET